MEVGGEVISILETIRKLVVGFENDYHFDDEIVMHVNTIFMVLTQMGVGPINGFRITLNGREQWSDFTNDAEVLESVKTYVYIRTRLIFDPPTNSFLIEALERTARELEWRLNVEEGGIVYD